MNPLKQFLALYETRAEAARAIDVTPAYISMLAAGRRNVSPEVAERIENVTGGKVRKESLIWPPAA